MNWIVTNWKTGLTGVALALTAVAHWATTGTLAMADVMAVLGAFGLVVAKDGNVSGTGK